MDLSQSITMFEKHHWSNNVWRDAVSETQQKKEDSKRCMFIVTSVPQKRFSAVQTLCPNLLCKKTTKGEGGGHKIGKMGRSRFY